MSFTVTEEHVKAFLELAGRADWAPFIDAIDPNVKWVIVDPVADPSTSAGTYVCFFCLAREIISISNMTEPTRVDGKGRNPECDKIAGHFSYEVQCGRRRWPKGFRGGLFICYAKEWKAI